MLNHTAKIRTLSAQFVDTEQEAAFIAQTRHALNQVSLWILLAMLSAELLSWCAALWLQQAIATHPFNVAAKCMYLLCSLVALHLLKTHASAQVVSRFLLGFVMVYVFTKMGYQWVEAGATIRVLLNSFIVIFGLYLVAPIAFTHQLALAVLTSVSSISILALSGSEPAEWHRLALWIVSVNVFGAVAANRREHQRRRMFASQVQLDKTLKHERALQAQNQRLLALLNHELRNPLAAARAQAEAIAYHHPATASAIHDLGARIDDAVRLLHDWAQINEQITPIPLDDIDTRTALENASGALKRLYPSFPIRIQNRTWPPLALPSHILELVIKSLLVNAATHGFSARGALITARVGQDDVLHIRVRDWGNKQTRRRIQHHFSEPPRRGKTPADRGLGLHLIERVIAPEGGAIKLVGAPHLGTVVDVCLPLKIETS